MCIAVSEICCAWSLQSYETSSYVSLTFFKQKACKRFTISTSKGHTALFCAVKVQLDWSYTWLEEICHFKNIYIYLHQDKCHSSRRCALAVHLQSDLHLPSPLSVGSISIHCHQSTKKGYIYIYMEKPYYKIVFLITFMQFICFLVLCFSSHFSCGVGFFVWHVFFFFTFLFLLTFSNKWKENNNPKKLIRVGREIKNHRFKSTFLVHENVSNETDENTNCS